MEKLPRYKQHISDDLLDFLDEKLMRTSYASLITKNGRKIAIKGEERKIVVINMYAPPGPEASMEFRTGHEKSVKNIAIWQGLNSKNQIITSSSDGTVKVFDIEGKPMRTLVHGQRPVTAVFVSGDDVEYVDAVVLSGCAEGTVKVWGLKSGKLLKTLIGHSCGISSLCTCQSREGHLLVASADRSGAVRLWNIDSGECVRQFGC